MPNRSAPPRRRRSDEQPRPGPRASGRSADDPPLHGAAGDRRRRCGRRGRTASSTASAPCPTSPTAIRGASGSPSTSSSARRSAAAATRSGSSSTSSTRGKYHPLVRPAVLTSLLGYGLAVIAVVIDLGRFWSLWKVPIYVWRWSHSPQLEVALCVAAYTLVLMIELSPALFEKLRAGASSGLRTLAESGLTLRREELRLDPRARSAAADDAPVVARNDDAAARAQDAPALVHAVAAAALPGELHHHGVRGRDARGDVLRGGVRPARARPRCWRRSPGSRRWVALGWSVFRVGEVALTGKLGLPRERLRGRVRRARWACWSLAAAILLSESRRHQAVWQVRAAILLLRRRRAAPRQHLPGRVPARASNFSYFPAVPELLITFGIVAAEVAIYIAVVKTFPILRGPRAREDDRLRGRA